MCAGLEAELLAWSVPNAVRRQSFDLSSFTLNPKKFDRADRRRTGARRQHLGRSGRLGDGQPEHVGGLMHAGAAAG